MVQDVCQLPWFAGDVKTFVTSDSRTQYLFSPLLNAGTMFRSSFVPDLRKSLLWTRCFALWKELFHLPALHCKNTAIIYLVFMNKHLDLAFKTTWLPNEYYLLVVTFICALSIVWYFFSPDEASSFGILGLIFFMIPHWASMSHLLGTNRSKYIIAQPLLFHNYWIQ